LLPLPRASSRRRIAALHVFISGMLLSETSAAAWTRQTWHRRSACQLCGVNREEKGITAEEWAAKLRLAAASGGRQRRQ
jgi:hypothetical protein